MSRLSDLARLLAALLVRGLLLLALGCSLAAVAAVPADGAIAAPLAAEATAVTDARNAIDAIAASGGLSLEFQGCDHCSSDAQAADLDSHEEVPVLSEPRGWLLITAVRNPGAPVEGTGAPPGRLLRPPTRG